MLRNADATYKKNNKERDMRPRSLITLALLTLTLPLVTGCATIVHSGPRTVPISSKPEGATVSIYDRTGTQVQKQTTPFIATLPTKYKYFAGQSYRLVFEMPGYQKSELELLPAMSGWYIGNILFGGLLGMLVVDPLTGAMYNLKPEKVEHELTPEAQLGMIKGETILVMLKEDATPGELAAMTPLTPIE